MSDVHDIGLDEFHIFPESVINGRIEILVIKDGIIRLVIVYVPDIHSLFLGVVTPLNLYSNVENGRGVFAAIAPMTCDTIFIHP